jgi:hypothetical protein
MFTGRMHWCVLALAAALLVGPAAPAGAVGYWNMPTSFSQWWGYGCGPGYHAPMVLGPVNARDLLRPQMEIRLQCAPRPTCCWAGCDCASGEPLLEPTSLPDAAPMPAPEPAVLRPASSRPVGFMLQ